MPERRGYFVDIGTKEVRELSLPGDGIEFEIKATHDEVKEIKKLFKEMDKHGRRTVEYLAKPFDEWGADDERKGYDDNMKKVYQCIYELGTEETRQKITETGVIS